MCLVIVLPILIGLNPIQTTQPTPAEARLAAYRQRLTLEQASVLHGPVFKSVGPVACGGRVSDVEGYADRPHTFRVAYASGGLWVTENHGTIWTPLFDRSPSITIGDFATDPNDWQTIWLGTGEKNASRSSYAGTGVYFSSDGGTHWDHRGLAETHHISRILVHPEDGNTVYVAAIGHLYSPNPQRGVYRTTDQGRTWQHVLRINDTTGVIDLAFDPIDPKRLYAAAWERGRTAWEFIESGPESGLYVSSDGGESWRRSQQGLPVGAGLGRIGIAVSPSHPHILYLSVDNQAEAPPKTEFKALTRRKLRDMSLETFLALNPQDIESFLREQNFHAEYTAEKIKAMLCRGDITLTDLLAYIQDGNAALFDRDILGAEVYRSDDRGQTWRKTHAGPLEDVVYSYGYYFGEIRVSPDDPDTVYLGGVPLLKSTDGGATFVNINEPNVHVDHQALWINPKNPNHLLLGNDGGICMTYDAGSSWQAFNRVPVGQFYTVATDQATPYRIYGGLQDNGVWRGPAQPLKPGSPPWEQIGTGDGAFVAIDPRDDETVYWGYQFGHYTRDQMCSDESLSIFPRHKLKQAPYRFNWMTPLILSHHHPDILYMGTQMVLRSLDRGETWSEISPDLTSDPPQGDVPFGTITALRESALEFGTLIAGTDDGRVWLSRGGSPAWEEISSGLPPRLWVTGLECSAQHLGQVFVTLSGYRNDDFSTYAFASDDWGQSWRSLKTNLPDEACNVIRQDPTNPDILYLGTDLGVWASFDCGASWMACQYCLPHVPVTAMEIHLDPPQLIAATHGRSVFVLDLQVIAQLTPSILKSDLHLFALSPVDFDRETWGEDPGPWWGKYEEVPQIDIAFLVADERNVQIEIDQGKTPIVRRTYAAKPGINLMSWDFQPERVPQNAVEALDLYLGENGKSYATPGAYTVRVVSERSAQSTPLTLRVPAEEKSQTSRPLHP